MISVQSNDILKSQDDRTVNNGRCPIGFGGKPPYEWIYHRVFHIFSKLLVSTTWVLCSATYYFYSTLTKSKLFESRTASKGKWPISFGTLCLLGTPPYRRFYHGDLNTYFKLMALSTAVLCSSTCYCLLSTDEKQSPRKFCLRMILSAWRAYVFQ